MLLYSGDDKVDRSREKKAQKSLATLPYGKSRKECCAMLYAVHFICYWRSVK